MNVTVPVPFAIGDLSVTPLVLGEIQDQPRGWFRDGADMPPDMPDILPVICLYITGPDCAVMVDACDPTLYPAKSGLVAPEIHTCLATAGVAVEAISHVILTHGHHDHYCGVWDGRADRPVFPNARHVLSERDWHGTSLTAQAMNADGAAADPVPLERLNALGLLDLGTPCVSLPAGITLIDAPGETDGHRVVHLSSGKDSFFFLADLFHLPQELDDQDLCPLWADAPQLINSRRRLASRIGADEATFMCSHMVERFSVTRLGTRASDTFPV